MKPALPNPWRLPVLIAALTLIPLIVCRADFAKLFYFQDELDLLNGRDRLGFLPWTGRMFAENFVPLFKLCWGGAISLFHGSYLALIVLMWLNHAMNAALLARILTGVGLSAPATVFAALIFGVSSLHLETLGWAVQWSGVQSITFLLLGLLVIVRSPRVDSTSTRLWLALFSLLSPLCFARGVLTGPVLAVALLFIEDHLNLTPKRLCTAACTIVPSLGVALFIAIHATGNHHHLGGHGAEVAAFAFHYFAGSPLHLLFSADPMTMGAAAGWAAVKILILGAAILLARGPLRSLLLALVAFDIGNALLLGIGRYHTGLPAALSSRYQYCALLCLLPFCACLLDRLSRVPPARVARATSWLTVCLAVFWAGRQWPNAMKSWQSWRGASLRAALAAPADKAPANFSGVHWLSNERTCELVKKYDLH